MKIVILGDTHTRHNEVDQIPGDMVIFTGDFMSSGYNSDEALSFLDWFSKYPAKYKVMIAGNHDRYVEDYPQEWAQMLLRFEHMGIVYLEDESCTIEGLNLYGTPHTRIFGGWAFNRTPSQLTELYNKIPDNTHILITHGPPYGVLDKMENTNRPLGEKELNSRIEELKNLRLHCFGHIHSGHGVMKNKNKGGYYTSINCAVLNEQYQYNWPPTIIEL